MPTVLVLSTVHPADDPRIREKLIPALTSNFEVVYATNQPGPADKRSIYWVPLTGPRLLRNLQGWWLAFSRHYQVLSLHDPETIPVGLAVALIRRKRVVFDVHEDIPAQILTKDWLPALIRPPLASAARVLLKLAERVIDITLAEPGYQGLFSRPHPVFPNYLPEHLPELKERRQGYAVYVGDVTSERGVIDFARAAAAAGLPALIVGRVERELEMHLQGLGAKTLGWLPHPAALEVAAGAVVGVSPLHDIPNYRHSLPTKVLEYLALGVPVVATDLPGTRAALKGLEPVQFVPPRDVDAMTLALQTAPRYLELAMAGASEVRARFRWPVDDVRSFYLPPVVKG